MTLQPPWDVGYEAKLMKKSYLKTFNRILKDNNVVWQRDEKLWIKYFGTWDQWNHSR